MNAMPAPWKSVSPVPRFEQKRPWHASCAARLLNWRATDRSFAWVRRLLCTPMRSCESREHRGDYDAISVSLAAFNRTWPSTVDRACAQSTQELNYPARLASSHIDL